MDSISQKIKRFLHDDERFFGFVDWFIEEFDVADLLEEAGMVKKKGVPAIEVFKYLIELPFFNITYHTDMKENITGVGFKKDVVRRFLTNENTDWVKFTTQLAFRILDYLRPDFKNSNKPLFLIIDDTDYERPDANYTDELSWQWDHNNNKAYKGYKIDALSIYYDAIILPLNGVFASTANEEKILHQTDRPMLARQSYQRRLLAKKKASEILLYQLGVAKDVGFPSEIVLFDSWYTHPKTIYKLLEEGYQVIGMLKAEGKTKFLYKNEWLNIREIFELNRELFPKADQNEIFFSTIVQARTEEKTFPLKLVFAENVHKNRDYVCIASTLLNLKSETTITYYRYRFTLEHIFKNLKNPALRLLNENRSLSLDAISAHLAIVLCRYMLILTEKELDMNPTNSIYAQMQKLAREESAVIELNTGLDLVKAALEAISDEKEIPIEELEDIVSKKLPQSRVLQRIWDDLPDCSKR